MKKSRSLTRKQRGGGSQEAATAEKQRPAQPAARPPRTLRPVSVSGGGQQKQKGSNKKHKRNKSAKKNRNRSAKKNRNRSAKRNNRKK